MKLLLPIIMLVGAVLLGRYLIQTGPEAKKRPFVERLPVVEVITLKSQSYSVALKASGLVKAGIQTDLISEVSGRIIKVSENFNEGSYFKNDQLLISIDASNYENSLAIARSEWVANEAALSQLVAEEASTKRSYSLALSNLRLGKAELSRLKSLKRNKLITRSQIDAENQKVNQLQQRLEEIKGKLNTFASRKIILDAKIDSSSSRHKQEVLNLSRTKITAPYSGRVLAKNVAVGQFVRIGNKLGTVYATDFVTVDLPLSLNQFELLGLDESAQNQNTSVQPSVIFTSSNTYKKRSWKGRVVRTSAALDSNSRQIKVIAQIDNPFEVKKGLSASVRIGQYLDAAIQGRTFKDVYVLHASAVRQNKEILLLKDNKIHIVSVDVLFNTSKETVIQPKENIEGGQLIITSLSQAIEGMKVITIKQHQLEQKKRADRKKKRVNDSNQEQNKDDKSTSPRPKSSQLPTLIRDSVS